MNDPKLAEMRFNLTRKPRRALLGKNVTQMHHAKQGIITADAIAGRRRGPRIFARCAGPISVR